MYDVVQAQDNKHCPLHVHITVTAVDKTLHAYLAMYRYSFLGSIFTINIILYISNYLGLAIYNSGGGGK